MPTGTGHTKAIRASRVSGSTVYDTKGDKIGQVEDIILDKTSNQILFAVVSFGGFLGIGEKYHSIPWSLLDYDKEQGGYVVSLSKETLKAAPSYDMNDFTKGDGHAQIRDKSYDYYKVARTW